MKHVIFLFVLLAAPSVTFAEESQSEFLARMERDQWCYMRRADQVSGQAEVKAEIERKAKAEGRVLVREYSCMLRPYNTPTNKTLYYKCETQLGLCDQNIIAAESQDGLMRAFLGMRDAQAANGEGYYTERPSGRRYWCDNAYGCQPR